MLWKAYQMILFPETVFPPEAWFFAKKSENLKVWKNEKYMKNILF